ncbi:MAG: hypothetical protein ACYTFA_13610, partial [Planctomycetota bacterium]
MAHRLYWTVRAYDEIRRACLDGSHAHALDIVEVYNPSAIAVDSSGKKMYWGGYGIRRANLDGSAPEAIIDGSAREIAIDSVGEKIYWTDYGSPGTIRRANLDGSDIEELISDVENLYGIAVDVAAGQMYWTVGLHYGDITGKIQRASLDGSNIETVYTTSPDLAPKSIAINVETGHMYWTCHGWYEGIWRAKLDGSEVEELIGASFPWSLDYLALDPVEGYLYYTVYAVYASSRGIMKADLDGYNRICVYASF